MDNRGTHFYLAMYWAQALAEQNDDPELKATFGPVAAKLTENETQIIDELNSAQGSANDLGGYYHPDDDLCIQAMRPSQTFNSILEMIA